MHVEQKLLATNINNGQLVSIFGGEGSDDLFIYFYSDSFSFFFSQRTSKVTNVKNCKKKIFINI